MFKLIPNPENPQLPHLEMERLYLRPIERGDAAAMFAYGSRPDVARLGGFPVNQDIKEVEALIVRDQAKTASNLKMRIYAIIDKTSDQMLGTINFNQKIAPKILTMGYVLHPDYWGRGMMVEAGEAMLHLAFEYFSCHKIEMTIYDYNVQSQSVARKLGFTQEGRLRQRLQLDMIYRDALIFGLLAEEWQSRQKV
ncbi:GNAT family N-acetyltransferase [Streptococcus merionis]|uniref:GNAT family N-acetyltransferase n=1 Tax=Streptococcus merionis TaxID=400065 RepID=UPI0026EF9B68|nr:GNAT family protein [Streptococcus merionis]